VTGYIFFLTLRISPCALNQEIFPHTSDPIIVIFLSNSLNALTLTCACHLFVCLFVCCFHGGAGDGSAPSWHDVHARSLWARAGRPSPLRDRRLPQHREGLHSLASHGLDACQNTPETKKEAVEVGSVDVCKLGLS
jgi:hypothetical protein